LPEQVKIQVGLEVIPEVVKQNKQVGTRRVSNCKAVIKKRGELFG